MVKNEILEKGCYLGHLSEIDPSLMVELDKLKPLCNRDFYTRVTHSYLGHGEYGREKVESTETNSFLEAEEIKRQQLELKKAGKSIWQIFHTFSMDTQQGNKMLNDNMDVVKTLFLKILSYCYGEDMVDKVWDIHRGVINLTNFTKDCFIENHADGGSPRMVCNILIYLNEDWEDGDGGELVLEEKYKQQPKYGNFAVLDFLKTNPLHLVTPVLKENSNRFAILTGILYDENYFNSLK